ncbi:hypothetical protein [Streptomyces sp. DSM 110735]|uniref:hypothetical protein n=1 Tax=Streptomyces sp. DSM 110735 TaxID=2775031 RepID=UPI0018F4D707|nr:hypothetical protein [Streptomyces sp. DSM 110735]MBJ7905480.1 hypothetical protein [Streptomyces sp. DSM 110735]
MSQSAPPPVPQSPQTGEPVASNPYAGEPGAVPVAPPAPQPAAPVRSNLVGGLLTALGAAVVAGGLYGVVIGLTEHEIGWAAVGVGFVIGLAAGKVGGRNAVLPVVSVVLALAAVYLGQLVGEAMIISKLVHRDFLTVFLSHFSVVQDAWQEEMDPLTWLFFVIAGYTAFTGTRKAAG